MDMAKRTTAKQQRGKTEAMAGDVMVMEQRLAELKGRMALAREKNEAGRRCNPTGTTWASARTDLPVNSQAYAAKVLATKPQRRRDSAGSSDAARVPEALINPLLNPGEPQRLDPPPQGAGASAAARKQRFGAEKYGRFTAEDEAAMDALAGRFASTPVGENPAQGGTRKDLFSWNPSAALPADDDDEYEDLLGPEPPPPSSGMGAGTGSLLDGDYSEADTSEGFAAAVAAWRTGGVAAEPAAAASSSSTWPAAASTPAAPTLAQSVAALTAELGLAPNLPLMEAVRSANEVVGLPAQGTLSEQVKALLATTGVVVQVAVEPRRGLAPQAFSTQTKPNYLELLNLQKRRDGLDP